MTDDRAFLTDLFTAAVTAADPEAAMARVLPAKPRGRTVVIGAGKGAAQMAQAFERLWGEPVKGVVVTRYGYGGPTDHIRVLEANHPVPDAAGMDATRELFSALHGLTADDLVVALICGGGSALLPAPPKGLTLEDEQALNEALLASGAPISAMNAIRKQVSGIKGGRLAMAARPAKLVSLIVSDVPGDEPAQVASGPTVPDQTNRQNALNHIRDFNIRLPLAIMRHLEGDEGLAPEPSDAAFTGNEVHIIASASLSLDAAAREAGDQGIPAVILSDSIEGEARDIGQMHAAIAREIASRDRPFEKPVVVLSGGETTVTIRGKGGKGGRNTEFLLALARGISGISVTALAADTDGIDGSEDNAGAYVDGTSWARMLGSRIDPASCQSRHDAWTAFDAIGDLFVPGPTGTNVNDFRAMLIR